MAASEPGGDGSFSAKLPSAPVERNRLDIPMRLARGKKVLHFGCANEKMLERKIREGSLTHIRLAEFASELWGVDIFADGIARLRELGVERLVEADAERLGESRELDGQTFDLILATEILEHLGNPGLFLDGVRRLLRPDGIMVLTVPNAQSAAGFGSVLTGSENVHPDHNYYFSYRTLSCLLGKHGYSVERVATYSNEDFGVSLWGLFFEKVHRAFGRAAVRPRPEEGARDGSGDAKPAGPPRGPLRKAAEGVAELLRVAARRLIYKINPFLADGLIFVVRPQ